MADMADSQGGYLAEATKKVRVAASDRKSSARRTSAVVMGCCAFRR